MIEALTPIGVLAGILIAMITAYRSEKSTQAAKQTTSQAVQNTAVAAEVLRAEKARQEYIDLLEKEQVIVKSALADALRRIGLLEASEEICQQDRALLTAENSRLRRLMEKNSDSP